jgi:hypothetical protein
MSPTGTARHAIAHETIGNCRDRSSPQLARLDRPKSAACGESSLQHLMVPPGDRTVDEWAKVLDGVGKVVMS